MTVQDITGWKLAQAEPCGDQDSCRDMPADGWMEADVPGDVNVTLQKLGVVPDARYDCNAKELYFVTAKEWWYKTVFRASCALASGEYRELLFEGLDGTCDVFLNGEFLFRADNAFRPWRCRVGLREGENEIAVRFRSIDGLLGSVRFTGQTGWGNRRAFLRKPQFNFGWDWALPVPSLGIWKPVRLETLSGRLESAGVQGYTDGRVDFFFEADSETAKRGYTVKAELSGHGFACGKCLERRRPQGGLSMKINDPQLWYPNGYGEQPLYDWRITLLRGGKVLDERTGRVGLREVRAVEEPFLEEHGEGYSFRLEVNGIPVFCKGGNWIPTEIWPAAAKPEEYDFQIRRAREAHFNMLRVWGGGIYENDRFYDLCDENGILVWQDFMFAGAGYPVALLHDSIASEAEFQLKRLRSHACIALWCGINEDYLAWTDIPGSDTAEQADIVSDTDAARWEVDRTHDDPFIYTMLLRGLVSKYGFGVPYVESSPQSRDGMGNRPTSGNCHISCWKYALFETDRKYYNYRGHFEQVCSFDSEFCIQGPVSERYIRSFMAPENHWPPNEAWIYHIQRGHKNLPHYVQTMDIAGASFGEINSLQKYVKYGSTMHLEHMRSEFDAARHDWPDNGGTMMWMLNDCWPTSNWSIIDYAHTPKPAYYAAKRGCAPILPIVFERGGKVDFSVSNHTADTVSCEAEWGVMRLDGTVLSEEHGNAVVYAYDTCHFARIPRESIACPADGFLFLRVKAGGKALDTVTYFPDYWREVPFTPAELKITAGTSEKTADGYETAICVESKGYARMAHLTALDDAGVWFSDNFFDIPDGESRRLTAQSARPLTEADIACGDWFSEWQ